jgi:methylated-DNA-[protein]-cysteine S-methyltransferase
MSTTYLDSPVGLLRLVAEDGALVQLHMLAPDAPRVGDDGPDGFEPVLEQLTAYFAGELRSFAVSLALGGTPFQERVWAALQEIPFGETASYGELATAIGRPTASRAVGAANSRNPVAIVVPCHRVIASTGKLHGYAGGLERKQLLLAHERRVAGAELALL